MNQEEKKKKLDDQVTLIAKFTGFKDETPVTFVIWKEVKGEKIILGQPETKIVSDKAEVKWDGRSCLLEEREEELKMGKEVKAEDEPECRFAIEVEGEDRGAESLRFLYPLAISLKDKSGNPVNDLDYEITFSDGTKKTDKFKNGEAKTDEAPYGKFSIRLVGSHFLGFEIPLKVSAKDGTQLRRPVWEPVYGIAGTATVFKGVACLFKIASTSVINKAEALFGYPYGKNESYVEAAVEEKFRKAKQECSSSLRELEGKKKKLEADLTRKNNEQSRIEKEKNACLKKVEAMKSACSKKTDEKQKEACLKKAEEKEKECIKKAEAKNNEVSKSIAKLEEEKKKLETDLEAKKKECSKMEKCLQKNSAIKKEECSKIDVEKEKKEAREFYSQKLTELKNKVSTEAEGEVLDNYGLVCNTFVEIVMRESKFEDFPLTDAPYHDADLDWANRHKDWVERHGGKVFKKDKLENIAPQPGDIIIFERPTSTLAYHENLVRKHPSEEGHFQLIGARGEAKLSGLSYSFQKYSEIIDNVQKLGQKAVLFVLRPPYTS